MSTQTAAAPIVRQLTKPMTIIRQDYLAIVNGFAELIEIAPPGERPYYAARLRFLSPESGADETNILIANEYNRKKVETVYQDLADFGPTLWDALKKNNGMFDETCYSWSSLLQQTANPTWSDAKNTFYHGLHLSHRSLEQLYTSLSLEHNVTQTSLHFGHTPPQSAPGRSVEGSYDPNDGSVTLYTYEPFVMLHEFTHKYLSEIFWGSWLNTPSHGPLFNYVFANLMMEHFNAKGVDIGYSAFCQDLTGPMMFDMPFDDFRKAVTKIRQAHDSQLKNGQYESEEDDELPMDKIKDALKRGKILNKSVRGLQQCQMLAREIQDSCDVPTYLARFEQPISERSYPMAETHTDIKSSRAPGADDHNSAIRASVMSKFNALRTNLGMPKTAPRPKI